MKWVHPAVAGVGIPRQERRLHADLHSYLAASGVDGVKCDVQGAVTMFGWDCGGCAAVAARFHGSLEGSVPARLPGNHQINSMCCALEDLHNLKHSAVARLGEDFYPLQPASHLAHVANAAYVALMVGALAFPDWDM
jgi:raffinose synthase